MRPLRGSVTVNVTRMVLLCLYVTDLRLSMVKYAIFWVETIWFACRPLLNLPMH